MKKRVTTEKVMKPISAEDIKGTRMTGNKKTLGIVILFVSFLIASINSILITNFSILDTDPGTYAIVVMLMLFLFIVFLAKEEIDFRYSRKGIAIGAAVFLIYIILFSFLRMQLSFKFLSYRIDALLFPFIILSFMIMIFGYLSVRKTFPILIYSIFASPLFLLPLLNLNTMFANWNASLVYDFIKAMGISASKAGLVIASTMGSSITVSTTCVSLGIFAAFVMLLLPIAYLYDGDLKNKLYWVLTGIAFILVLNILRMLFVTLVWAYYGLNNAVMLFHLFAGQLIFYIAIVVMVLITYKYGLTIKKWRKGTFNRIKSFYVGIDQGLWTAISIVILFAFVAFFLNLGYSNSVYAPATLFMNNSKLDNLTLYPYVLKSVENSNGNVLFLGQNGQTQLFSLENLSGVNDSIFVITNASYSPISTESLGNPVGRPNSYLLRNGISLTAQIINSSNHLFAVDYFSAPYNISGSWIQVNYILFKNVSQSALPYCAYYNLPQNNYVISLIYNLVDSGGFSNRGLMCKSYQIAASINR